jgi:hypothetical protein
MIHRHLAKATQKHKFFWLNKQYFLSAFLGVVLLAGSLYANYYANYYSAISASNSVTDIILDNIPVINVSFAFSEGAVIFVLVLIGIALFEPKYIPFGLKSISLFVLIRSCFMILTHLAPPQGATLINPGDFINKVSQGSDLFFSAHTGLPFLMAIIFWQIKYVRYFFLLCTIVGGISVLLGHLHYSIDVFSALFITFGIYHIAKKIFPRDFRLTEI